MPDIKAELEEIVRTMVDFPDEVEVWDVNEGRSTVLELAVDPDDLGKVIGRQGRTARSLRVLLDTRGERDGTNYELRILEEDEL